MAIQEIGIRELQANASRVVRAARDQGTRFRVASRGRDTGVEVGPAVHQTAAPADGGLTGAELLGSALYRTAPAPAGAAALAAFVEDGRDAQGTLGTVK
ncbi:MAG: hypothetical protein LBH68_02085 [Bifidobacteriaceae bacterium]|jgi:hypothetical protein|nr:hypothetical protein [Bifidobacteriaceae bacterium]